MLPLPERASRYLLVGCGDLGSRIARRLLARNATVFTLTRSPPSVDGVHPLFGDVTVADAIPALPTDIQRIVYCLTPAARDEFHYRLAYPLGLAHVLRRVGDAAAGIAFVSSTAVYGPADGAWVDETSACVPEAFNGRVLAEAEALALARPGGLVFRLGGIYGPGRESLIRNVVEGRPNVASNLDWGNRIHVDDAAEAICHLLGQGSQGAFNLVDSEPASAFTVMRYIAQVLQLDAPPSPADGAAPRGRRISNRKLLDSGFSFRYPDFRCGYQSLLPASPR